MVRKYSHNQANILNWYLQFKSFITNEFYVNATFIIRKYLTYKCSITFERIWLHRVSNLVVIDFLACNNYLIFNLSTTL